MNWKSTAVVSGATLLATWLGWTSTPPHAATADRAAATPRETRPAAGVDIQDQAQKLEHRVRAQVEYQDPTRNPFIFATRKPAARPGAAAAVTPAPAATPAPASPVPFPMVLAGVAGTDGQRTAIVEIPSGVVFVKEGDRVGSFTVAHVTEAAAELVDADGAARTLTLKP